jgi:hypothetical protein
MVYKNPSVGHPSSSLSLLDLFIFDRLHNMQLPSIIVALLASLASAGNYDRPFILHDDANYGGTQHHEARWNDNVCCTYTLH